VLEIENKLHRILDAGFGEDLDRKRVGTPLRFTIACSVAEGSLYPLLAACILCKLGGSCFRRVEVLAHGLHMAGDGEMGRRSVVEGSQAQKDETAVLHETSIVDIVKGAAMVRGLSFTTGSAPKP